MFLCKKDAKRTKDQNIKGRGEEHGEGCGTQRRGGNRNGQTPRVLQEPGYSPRASSGGANNVGHDGRCRHAERDAERYVEAGRAWVRVTSRWTEFRARK